MKIFLANPPYRIKIDQNQERYFVRAGSRWPFSVIKNINQKPDYIPFPFYLAYTASILEKNNHQVIVDDGVATNQTERQFLDTVYSAKPDVILFETSTPTIDYDIKLVNKIKSKLKDTIVCFSGTHATTFYRQILAQGKIDYVFISEYELNFNRLIDYLSSKQPNPSLKAIPGIAYKNNRQIFFTEPQLIDPLDQLPPPARHLFPNNDCPDPTLYWDGFCQYKPAIQMHATRGCPFRCNFCLWNQVMYRNQKYRMFSPKRIVDEMEGAVNKYNAKEIYFDDDTFTANKKHVLAVCREINRRKLTINWSVMGDAMITDKDMIDAMANAGCIGIKFGVESGNAQILKHIEKPVRFDRLKEFTDWCARRKIKTHATFTFGLSGETRQTMNESLNLAKSLDVDSVQFSITTPFPGTRYYEEVKKENLILAKNWSDFDGASDSIVRFTNLPSEVVRNYWQGASGKWLRYKLLKPFWVFRQLYYLRRMIEGQGLSVIWIKTIRLLDLLFS